MASRLLFPGAWLAMIVLVGMMNIFLPVAVIITSVLGSLCYVGANAIRRRGAVRSGRRMSPLAMHFAFIAVILVGSALLVRTFEWVAWNPIGNADDLGWGARPWGSSSCDKSELGDVPSGNGEVASVRRGICEIGFFGGTDVFYYFVFVHRTEDRASTANLVFRYVATARGEDLPPKVQWKAASILQIAVGDGAILQVSKQRRSIDGIAVDYNLPKAKNAPAFEFWQRPFL